MAPFSPFHLVIVILLTSNHFVGWHFPSAIQCKKKKMMSSHWKLFLFPCHKVWAHFGMALWFISLTSSAGSAQTPREIQALPPCVPGKVDFRSPSLKKKKKKKKLVLYSLKLLAAQWVPCPGKYCFIIELQSQDGELVNSQNSEEQFGYGNIVNLLH